MGWSTNTMKIEMNTTKAAQKAAESIKSFMIDNYNDVCAERFVNDLRIEKNTIFVEDSYSFGCMDYFELIPELCKAIAEAAPSATFEGTACATSGYSEDTYHSFSFKNNTLKINSQYFPEGDSYICPDEDCCGFICNYEDFEADEDRIFVCEECGKEYKFSELEGTLPEIIENTFIIK